MLVCLLLCLFNSKFILFLDLIKNLLLIFLMGCSISKTIQNLCTIILRVLEDMNTVKNNVYSSFLSVDSEYRNLRDL